MDFYQAILAADDLTQGDLLVVRDLPHLLLTHSCELDLQKNKGIPPADWDNRIQIAPIWSRYRRPGESWDAIKGQQILSAFYMPPLAPDGLGAGIPAADEQGMGWPESFAELRGITMATREEVRETRLFFRLAPSSLGLLHSMLARYFGFRLPTDDREILALKGKTVRDVVVGDLTVKDARATIYADDLAVSVWTKRKK